MLYDHQSHPRANVENGKQRGYCSAHLEKKDHTDIKNMSVQQNFLERDSNILYFEDSAPL